MNFDGGFMGGGTQFSPGGAGNASERNQSLRPVTIYQVLNATQASPDSDFLIEGQGARDVTLVACIRNMTQGATGLSILVEDGTGQIEVRLWLPEDGDLESRTAGLETNLYARITGSIKFFQQKRSILCNSIRPLTDMNEMLYHMVHTIHTTDFFAGRLKQQESTGISSEYKANGANPYSAEDNTYGGVAPVSEDNMYSELPVLQRKIMQHLKSLQDSFTLPDEGISIEAIAQHLGGTVGIEKTRDLVTQLTNEGLVYDSVDEDHVLPT